jgi:hypothetical protein
MNARAYQIALKLRAYQCGLPGTVSLGLEGQDKGQDERALLLIMASSDEAVISLGLALGLTSYEIRRDGDWWWRVASGQHAGGEFTCQVVGPPEQGLPPMALGERTERTSTAPVTLTAEQVLEAARARGVSASDTSAGRLILLASLGLDLSHPEIHRALCEMHLRSELRLVRIRFPSAVRIDLAERGLSPDLVDASALREGRTIFHAVVIP